MPSNVWKKAPRRGVP